MKFKTIASLCKEEQTLMIYERPGRNNIQQWIGTACALYPLSDVPRIKKEGFCNILDIPENKRADFTFVEDRAPTEICFDDVMEGERQLNEPILTISSKQGRMLQFYASDRNGVICMDDRYLGPLSDMRDVLTLHERMTAYGRPYFAAKMGFLLLAVIMPMDPIKTEFVAEIDAFSLRCRRALAIKSIRTAPSAEQYVIAGDGTIAAREIDPETGEIAEENR